MESILETGPKFETTHPLHRAEGTLPTGRLVRIASAALAARALEDALRDVEDLPARVPGVDIIAATVASALDPTDWILMGPRQLAAALYRGLPLEKAVSAFLGTHRDPQLGHVPPGHTPDRERRILPAYSSTGAFLTQAAGVGWAMRLSKSSDVILCFFDPRRASEADVHTGLNFAGVFEARTVFLTISAPDVSFARRGVAYGLGAVRVDGSDIAAVAETTAQAVASARSGAGATIVDVVLSPSSEPASSEPLGSLERALGRTELEAIRSRAIEDVEAALAAGRTEGPLEPSSVTAALFGAA